MNIPQFIIRSIAQVKKHIGSALLLFVLKQKTGKTYLNGATNNIYADDFVIQGIYDRFTFEELQGGASSTSTKIILFIEDQTKIPKPDDLISYANDVYEIIKCNDIKVKDNTIVCILEVTK